MAISTPRDNNRVPTLMAASSADGVTPVSVCVMATNHSLCINDGTTGTDYGVPDAVRDANRVTTLMGTSSADGITPVEVYCDSSGNLLVKST